MPAPAASATSPSSWPTRSARIATHRQHPGEKAAFVRLLGTTTSSTTRTVDFVEAVLDWSGGRGVDVVLDALGRETFRRSLAATCWRPASSPCSTRTDVDWKEGRDRNLSIAYLMLTPCSGAARGASSPARYCVVARL